jgi:hypothetical protein
MLTQELEANKQQKKQDKITAKKANNAQNNAHNSSATNNTTVNTTGKKKKKNQGSNNSNNSSKQSTPSQQPKNNNNNKPKSNPKEISQEELSRIELEREQAMLLMTDSEKRALLFAPKSGNNNASAKEIKCDQCNCAILGTPFCRLEYKYCTTKCVKEHSLALQSPSTAANATKK